MIISPSDEAGKKFAGDLEAFENAFKNNPTEKDLPLISQELSVSAIRFGKGQKASVEKTITGLDESLRSMVEVIDNSNSSMEITISSIHSSARKLHRISEEHPDNPIAKEVSQEIDELTKAMHKHHELNKALQQQYQTELAKMHERLSGTREAANLDGLTKLSNRAGHENYLKGISSKATPNSPYSMALVDISGFKKINDAYGHGTGDAALTYFADALKKEFGSAAHLSRLGGDEFTVISHTHAENLTQSLLKLQQRISSGNITLAGKQCRLGINFSCIEIDGELPYSGLMREADERLYEAKHAASLAA